MSLEHFRTIVFALFTGLLSVGMITSILARPASAQQDSTSNFEDERRITFSDYEWIVKSGYIGPGPNRWADDEESVWVDNEGSLHLKIRQIDGVWHSAEVYSPGCSTFTTHSFTLASQIDELDPNTVAAVFLYQDDETEIDIEFSRWGDALTEENGQYVVQPYYRDGNMRRFAFDSNAETSAHTLVWWPDAIDWDSQVNGEIVQQWRYTGNDVPGATSCLRVHINHWLRGGQAPTNGQESELVITRVRLPSELYIPFVEVGPEPPATQVMVQAEGDEMWGTVSPPTFCNEDYKIVAYAKTDIWYIQPFADERQNIQIQRDCTWQTWTHEWRQVAAFLVSASYEPPATIRTGNCPPLPLNPDDDSAILAGDCVE